MKNHFICALLSILIVNLCGLIPNSLSAEEWEEDYYYGVFIDGVYYSLYGKNSTNPYTAEVIRSIDSLYEYSGEIFIPSSVFYDGAEYQVKEIAQGAFYNCKDITSVTFSDGLTSIQHQAFENCSNLKSIVIPNSVTFIGEDSFHFCGLTSLVLPSSLTTSEFSFVACPNLTSIIIPNGVTFIDFAAFDCCTKLQTITIPQSLGSIDHRAFAMSGLTSIITERDTPPSIQSHTFKEMNKNACTLYVPYGSKSAYASAVNWSEFKNIVEMSFDLSELENAIYIEPTEGRIGGTMDISIKLKNGYAASGFQFTLEVPKCVTINSWSLSEDRLPSGATTGDKVSSYSIDGNKISVACALNYDGESFTGNDGEIATVNVSFGEDMLEAFYPLFLTSCDVTNASGKDLNLNNTQSSVTLDSYVVGDANGDGVVRIGDATTILNYIVGNTSANFKEKSADANEDGQVRIGDVTTVLNIIVGK